ncbi:MAG: hypothetical protein ACI4DW_03025, partial [Lachnospiraceae bacterium]
HLSLFSLPSFFIGHLTLSKLNRKSLIASKQMPEETMLNNVIIIEGISGLEPESVANIIAHTFYHTGRNVVTH